jgi:6-phosphogluconolactonase
MQKLKLVAITSWIVLAALSARGAGKADELVYVGTHGIGGGGPPAAIGDPRNSSATQGIYAARLNTKTGQLTSLGSPIELRRATWLVTHPTLSIIYSVAETAGGMAANSEIHGFVIDPASGALKEINKVDAGGRDSTHLDIDPVSKTLFVANHGSGSVTALPLHADGSLGTVVSDQKTSGTGPHRRQKSPAAHGVAIDPTHRYLLVADFGADRIFVYHFEGIGRTLTPASTPFVAVPPGSGPRHLLFHPNGRTLYLNNELSGELRSFQWDATAGILMPLQSLSPYPANYSGEKSASEIAISEDGRILYTSWRGDQDNIIVYSIDKQSNNLTELQKISAQGKAPWSFGIDRTGRWMLVTNEGSNSVAVLKIKADGTIAPTNQSLSVPSPVTVAFYLRKD